MKMKFNLLNKIYPLKCGLCDNLTNCGMGHLTYYGGGAIKWMMR